jgi:glutamyl/glutaminyl-tRNA synthetase
VGGARTALFNWLYARHHGGTFVLRIEDTDVERSSAGMVTGILESMKWLGLDWDEGPEVGGPHAPYCQSERLDLYRAAARGLVSSGHGYYCYCTPEELQAKRHAAGAQGQAWTYDRTCLALAPAEIAAREAAGRPRAVRFLVPEGRTSFDDLVRGHIEFDRAHLEDFVILRSDGHPTYHLSVVVDDMTMAITHVVRGDDHISNTPKQVLLYEALGAPVPTFAHVPLILGPDKKRLSKRHGATSVGEYEAQGYLPEAMINFLALLGWSPVASQQASPPEQSGATGPRERRREGVRRDEVPRPESDREVFTRDELVARFTLDGISGGNAVFNPEKLDWFNQQHISRMPAHEILARLSMEFKAAGLNADAMDDAERTRIEKVIDLVKPRARKLADVVALARPFWQRHLDRDAAAMAKHLGDAGLREPLMAWRDRVGAIGSFTAPALEAALRSVADEHGVKAGALIHATRVAVTGQAVSPGIFEVLELMGQARVVSRLAEALEHLPARRGG